MVQICIVQKYGIEAYPEKYDEYFMFYDTISDHPIFFNDEFLFMDIKDFLFYLKGSTSESEADRYLGKIPVKFGGESES